MDSSTYARRSPRGPRSRPPPAPPSPVALPSARLPLSRCRPPGRKPNSHRSRLRGRSRARLPLRGSGMIVGEVKESEPKLNAAARKPAVLAAALARLGCCSLSESAEVVDHLARRGRTSLPNGHRPRMVVFAPSPRTTDTRRIDLSHWATLSAFSKITCEATGMCSLTRSSRTRHSASWPQLTKRDENKATGRSQSSTSHPTVPKGRPVVPLESGPGGSATKAACGSRLLTSRGRTMPSLGSLSAALPWGAGLA